MRRSSRRLLPAALMRDAARAASADPLTAPVGAALVDLAMAAEKATECA
jgi:hypothetical protein